MGIILLILGIIILLPALGIIKSPEAEDLKKHRKTALVVGTLFILAGVFDLLPAEKPAEEGKKEAPQVTEKPKPRAEKEEEEYTSVFSRDTVNAIVTKLEPLAAKGYKAKISEHRGQGEFSDNYNYIARVVRNHKVLASIIYSSTFHLAGGLTSPPQIQIYLNCYFERGLLSGCADPEKDPDGFLVIKSLWDTMGFDEASLNQVLEIIASAYKEPDRYESVRQYLKSQSGKEYAFTMNFSYPLRKQDGKLEQEHIVKKIVFTVIERENYDKAYGPIK